VAGKVGAEAEEITFKRLGKKVAGRHLDGRIWDQFPRQVAAG
jgi:protein gp37